MSVEPEAVLGTTDKKNSATGPNKEIPEWEPSVLNTRPGWKRVCAI